MKNLGQMQKMLQAAKDMQEKMQRELAELRVEGTSGGGMVAASLDGHKNLVALRIDPEVVNPSDVEMLQDLVTAAVRDAAAKVDEETARRLGGLGAGLKIPGLF
ncbi:MAG: YbaB/EbfC family nucleoid-associated protein [Candidatus Aminicenantes bacterium]|nr:YbaB/EbfC family nucleoid-associated protein [Candidatus Aminicenantes bacterium]